MRYTIEITVLHDGALFVLSSGDTPMSASWKEAWVAMAITLPGYQYHTITECPRRSRSTYKGKERG